MHTLSASLLRKNFFLKLDHRRDDDVNDDKRQAHEKPDDVYGQLRDDEIEDNGRGGHPDVIPDHHGRFRRTGEVGEDDAKVPAEPVQVDDADDAPDEDSQCEPVGHGEKAHEEHGAQDDQVPDLNFSLQVVFSCGVHLSAA